MLYCHMNLELKGIFAISGKGIDQVQLNKTIIFLIASNNFILLILEFSIILLFSRFPFSLNKFYLSGITDKLYIKNFFLM